MTDYPMSLRLIRIGRDSLGFVIPRYICEAENLKSGCILPVTISTPTKEVFG